MTKDERKEKRRKYRREYMRKYRVGRPDKPLSRVAKDQKNSLARKRHSENPEKQRAHGRAKYHRHKKKYLAANRAWRAANPERWKELCNAWKAANPERMRELLRRGEANRRAREIGADGVITKADIDDLFIVQSGLCGSPHCRKILQKGFHVDHIMPLSRGGSNKRENLQLLCRPCNLSKGRKTMEEWMGVKSALLMEARYAAG